MSFLGHGRLDDLHRQEMAKLESVTAPYEVGEAVEVYSFGRWYRGTVARCGSTRVKVTYTTGTGTTRTKAFTAAKLRAVSR